MAEQHDTKQGPGRGRGAIKFVFWGVAAAGLMYYLAHSHQSGQLAAWFYHSAGTDGYAINADTFKNASKATPALLAIGAYASLDGPVAVKVKKGDRLPAKANGVIGVKILKEGKRAVLEGNAVKVMIPWEIQQAKGFKFKDTFKHKGIETYPWAGLWNVLMVFGLGLALGFMAEGLTDLMGIKLDKIRHFEGH